MLFFGFAVFAAESTTQFSQKRSRSCCLQINLFTEAELRETNISKPYAVQLVQKGTTQVESHGSHRP